MTDEYDFSNYIIDESLCTKASDKCQHDITTICDYCITAFGTIGELKAKENDSG